MSTMLGTNAFDMMFIKGLMFLVGGTRLCLDYYESTKDTIFVVVALIAIISMVLLNA